MEKGSRDMQKWWIAHLALLGMMGLNVSCGDADADKKAAIQGVTFGGEYDEVAYGVDKVAGGGYVIVGRTNTFGAGQDDVYLIRIDESGGEVWTKTYGGAGGDKGHAVRQTADGGFIVAGSSLSSGIPMKGYLLRVDPDGNEIWSKTYPTTSTFSAVRVTDDQGYILAGQGDESIVKTDSDGGQLWAVSNSALFSEVLVTADGAYAALGTLDSDIYLLKIDAQGNELWSKSFDGGGSEWDEGCSLYQLADGGYVVGGMTYTGYVEQVFVLRLDETGDKVWAKETGGLNIDRANAVLQASDGNILVAGVSDFEVLLKKLDLDGEMIWTSYVGTDSSAEEAYGVVESPDGGYVVVGKTSYSTRQDTSPAPRYDVHAFKTDPDGTVVW